MQQALRGTVSDVRKGSREMHIGIAEIVAGNNDLSSRTEQQAASLAQTAASMEQLTATVGQNADNARQASELAKCRDNGAGGRCSGQYHDSHHAGDRHQLAKKLATLSALSTELLSRPIFWP